MCSQFYHVLACCQKPVTVAEIEGIVGRCIGLAAYYSQGKQGKGWMHENLRRKGTSLRNACVGLNFGVTTLCGILMILFSWTLFSWIQIGLAEAMRQIIYYVVLTGFYLCT